MKKIFIPLACWLIFVVPNWSREADLIKDVPLKLSLKDAQEHAIQNNYEALNSRLDIASAEKQIKEALSGGLPQINGTVSYTDYLKLATQLVPGAHFGGEPGSFVELVMGTKHNATLGVYASQMIFNSSFFLGLKAARIYLELNEKNLEKTQNDIRATVAETYYTVLIAEENRRILQENLENMKRIHYETVELFKEGFAEETDVDQLQISVTSLESELNTIERQISISYMLLKYQLGLDLKQGVILTDRLKNILEWVEIDRLITQEFYLKENVDYKLAETQERLSQFSLKSEKASYLPTLSLVAGYQQNAMRDTFNFFSSDGKWYPNYYFGLDLQWSLFSGNSRKQKVAQAKIALEQAKNSKKQIAEGLLLEVEQAKNNLKSYFETYQNSIKNMTLAQKVYQRMAEKYREGISSNLELIQAHDQCLSEQSKYIQAISGLLNGKNTLDKLLENN